MRVRSRIVVALLAATSFVAFVSACGGDEPASTDTEEARPEVDQEATGPRADARENERTDERGDAPRRRKNPQAEAQQPQENRQPEKQQPAASGPQAKQQKAEEQQAESKPERKSRPYRVAFRTCSKHSPKELAREYGGSPDDYSGIAEAYARKSATPRSRQDAYAGCYDALVEEWGPDPSQQGGPQGGQQPGGQSSGA